MTDPRSSNLSRRLNLPPSYLLIHRVSTAGIGVLCQLECEGPFRGEVLRWIPGYSDKPAKRSRRVNGTRTARGTGAANGARAQDPAVSVPGADGG
jgi:hypothetical protein